ncbi:MAG TPA: C39 family peptidase, partial [Spirochaetales bacterium]|nr:C39 family peptidase [Spirochaetales bacterium]
RRVPRVIFYFVRNGIAYTTGVLVALLLTAFLALGGAKGVKYGFGGSGTAPVPEAATVPAPPPAAAGALEARVRRPTEPFASAAEHVELPVPFIPEMPEGVSGSPWVNACEEASIAMIAHYYSGRLEVSAAEAIKYMRTLFAFQDGLYRSNANSDATRSARIIEEAAGFRATIVEYPSLEDLKRELREGRPIMTFHYGFALGNPNIPFLPTGSSFHTLVLKGYDDRTREFITNDNGDRSAGAGRRYPYDTFLDSLHDYRYEVARADGPPRAIFTAPE